MIKIISLLTAGCLLVTAANAQEEKKVVIVKKMDTTIDQGLNLKKQPFILSPACWTYFDMKNEGKGGWAGRISPAEMYNWDPFGDMLGVTPETRQLAHGAIACTWSEQIPTMKIFGDRTYPRLASFSERIWSGGKSENPSILGWVDYRDKVLIPFQLKRYDALTCLPTMPANSNMVALSLPNTACSLPSALMERLSVTTVAPKANKALG